MLKPGDFLNKNNTNYLSKLIFQLDSFTQNLEAKVDGILKAQQTQFVNSYKIHMSKVKEEFHNMSMQMKKKDEKIMFYENEGKMSYLIKRVQFLQEEQKKLLTDLQLKKTDLKKAYIDVSIKKSEIRRLEQKVKQLLKYKVEAEQTTSARNQSQGHQSIPTFATEIGNQSKVKELSKMKTQQKSLKLRSLYKSSERSEHTINPEDVTDSNKLQRQLSQLKKQNRELISFNSKFITENSTMQRFFIDTVSEIKKNIAIRKQVKTCSLEQFRKEDKLELLIKILSNDDIIYRLYEVIFGKKINSDSLERDPIANRSNSLKGRINLQRSAQYHFPSIKSARIH